MWILAIHLGCISNNISSIYNIYLLKQRFGYSEDYYILRSLVIVSIDYVIELITDLPFDLYSTFVIEEKHGFNKQTIGLYIKDQIKSLLLMIVIGYPLFSLLLFIIIVYYFIIIYLIERWFKFCLLRLVLPFSSFIVNGYIISNCYSSIIQ